MWKVNPCQDSGPLFHVKNRPILYKNWQKTLRTLVSQAGYQGRLFSSHSLRRGGATTAFMAGASPDMIKLQGCWTSEAYQQYLEIPLQAKVEIQSLIMNLISF